MGPLAMALLINGGFKVMGGLNDIQRAEDQKNIEIATNNANAAMERANIAKNYTGLFDKMVSDLGTQANIFATAKVDKGSTLFAKGMQEHEKAFLENKANMESDLETINTQRKLSNTQSKLTAIYKKQNIATDMLLTGSSNAIDFYAKDINKALQAERIKNGR